MVKEKRLTCKFTRKTGVKRKNKPFLFQLNLNRIGKKNKELREKENNLLEFIKRPLNALHRGYLYDNIIELNDLSVKCIDSYDNSWYLQSSVFNYIHDVCSIKTPPDYKVTSKECTSLRSSISTLTKLFMEYSKQQGIRRLSYKKHKTISKWFVVYLTRCYKNNYIALKYSRDRSFNIKHGVENKHFSYNVLMRFVDFLESNNLIINFKGNVLYGFRPMSMMVINPEIYKILNIETLDIKFMTKKKSHVVINDDDGNVIKECDYTEDMMDIVDYGVNVLENYQNLISNRTITINGYEIPEYWLQRVHKKDITIASRVFDNGDIQGKSKDVRKLLVIDGEETIGLDFRGLHPAILLYQAGVFLDDHDPYPTIKDIKIDKKLINKFKKAYNICKYDPVRNIVKKLTLCLINAKSKNDAVGACYEDLQRDNMKRGTFQEYKMSYVGLPDKLNLHDIADQILKHNEVFADKLGTGVGVKLQRLDSDIVMYCIEVLTKLDIVVVPVHDCFICKVSDKKVVEQTMIEAFVKFVGEGSERNCKVVEE